LISVAFRNHHINLHDYKVLELIVAWFL
jgi:hypothetical protein